MRKEVRFLYSHARVPQKEITLVSPEINKERLRLKSAKSYTNPLSAINLCADKELHSKIKSVVKQCAPADYLAVIGIGGSSLGTKAIQEWLQGSLANSLPNRTKILYADTVDADELTHIGLIIEKALIQNKKVILNIISKSGNTIETIANAEVLVSLVSRYIKEYAKNIVVTSNEGSGLDNVAKKRGFHRLHIPKEIGGRYSVFSAVGLFPLALVGIDIDELTKGAQAMRQKGLEANLSKNYPALSASLRYYHAFHGQTIQDLFLFGNDFETTGKWYRQLFAESLGKGCDSEGKSCIGVTPTYSIGSNDMHSIAQLYLGGPFDKFTTFVKVEKNKNTIKLPNTSEFNVLAKNTQGKSMQTIMDAIYQGVTYTFTEKNRPFAELILADKSEYSMGQFLQFNMMEVMYLGALLKINPFDQPDIESYKTQTRKILSKA